MIVSGRRRPRGRRPSEHRPEGVEDFGGAERDALEHGLHEIAPPRGGVHADPEAGRAPVPVRTAEPRERRDERETAGDRGRARKLLKLGDIGEQADPLQPLDRRAGGIDAAVRGIDAPARRSPPDRRQNSVRKIRRSCPATTSAKAPVPKVTLASPLRRQPWP